MNKQIKSSLTEKWHSFCWGFNDFRINLETWKELMTGELQDYVEQTNAQCSFLRYDSDIALFWQFIE